MIKIRLGHTIILLICTLLVLWDFEAYSADADKEFHRLEYNAFDKSGNPFMLEWDISKGFFFNNRKNEALKFSTEIISDAEKNDINTVFAKRLIESNNITNVNPIYSAYNETENITGYEFNYTLKRSATYRAVRTSAEILFVLGTGYGSYWLQGDVNVEDWLYRYNRDGAKRKLKDGFRWDPNNFNTNTIYHLYAGASYYMAARSNDYSIPASFVWSFGGSFIWEFVCEWREMGSINDTIFTPTLGALTGEFFIQTANYIERNMKPGFLRETLMLILYPFGSINRWMDSSNSGDIRVRLIFTNPLQTAVERKIERDLFHR